MKFSKEEKLMINLPFFLFFDLKIAYNSVSIYNVLTKLSNNIEKISNNNIDIHGKCLLFITNLYLTLKIRTNTNVKLKKNS